MEQKYMPKIIMKMFVEWYFDYKYYDIDLEMIRIQQSYYFLASLIWIQII